VVVINVGLQLRSVSGEFEIIVMEAGREGRR
jgi:hypothetical protein